MIILYERDFIVIQYYESQRVLSVLVFLECNDFEVMDNEFFFVL